MGFFNRDNKVDEVRKELGADLQKLSEQIGTLHQELRAKNAALEEAQKNAAQAQQQVSQTTAQTSQDKMADALKHSSQVQQLNEQASQRSAELAQTQAKLTELQAQLAQAQAGAIPPTASVQPEHAAAQVSGTVGLHIGGTAYVAQAGGLPLRLRSAPGLAPDSVIGKLPPGTQMTLLGGPEDHDGYTWWHIRASDGHEGWVAGQDLRTQPE